MKIQMLDKVEDAQEYTGEEMRQLLADPPNLNGLRVHKQPGTGKVLYGSAVCLLAKGQTYDLPEAQAKRLIQNKAARAVT